MGSTEGKLPAGPLGGQRDRGQTPVRLMLVGALLALVVVGSAPAASAASPAFSPSRLKHIRVNGISIGYRTLGAGPPLVMIMGYSGTLYVWDPSLLTRLARRHTVIVFDNRGVLTTSRGRRRLTIALMADDTAALIRALGFRWADVLGWSMGGDIAQLLALRHPHQVRRLVLAATDPGGPHAIQPTDPVARRVLDDPHVETAQVLDVIFPRSVAGRTAAGNYVQRLAAWPGATPSDFAASPSIIRQQSAAEGSRLWFCHSCGAYPRLQSIRARTLVADGRRDIVEPPGNSRAIAKRIPGASLALYPGAGHAFLFQENAAFASRVLKVLGLTGLSLSSPVMSCASHSFPRLVVNVTSRP